MSRKKLISLLIGIVLALCILWGAGGCASSKRQYRKVNEKKVAFTKRDATKVVFWLWGGYVLTIVIRQILKKQ